MSRDQRAAKAARLHLLILLICGALGGAAAMFRQLLDEAEADVGCARRHGYRQGRDDQGRQ